MATITPEMQHEIEKAGERPVRVEDPENNRRYFLISAELYDRVRSLVDVEHIDRSLYEFGEFYALR